MTVKKEDLLRFIEGYTRANEADAKELKRRLKFITPEESREEYNDLCDFLQRPENALMPDALIERKIQEKVLLRSRLNRLSSKRFSE